MKKLILLASTIAILGSTALSQVKESHNKFTENDYLNKARKQKTAAWVCLAGGTALVTTAAIIGGTKATEAIVNLYTLSNEEMHNYGAETALLIIGGAAMATSIPLFISASHNKQKARLTVTEQKTAIGLPIAVPKKIPSLTLSISI